MSSKTTRDLLMPLHSPPFGGLPFPMLDFRAVMVEFTADSSEVARITPAPFEPDGNTLYAFIADNCQPTHSMAYHEAGILQKVTWQGRSAVTLPYIWTSTDTAMLAGRELFGMPKLMCEEAGHLTETANEVAGSLVKNGRTLFDLGIVIREQGAIEDLPFGADWAFVRHIPSPDPKRPAIRQLVWVQLKDFRLKECWLGRGWLDISCPSSSGIDRLDARAGDRAWYGSFAWLLDHAEILGETELSAEEA
ncbi:MAG: acetoacetate decarboxylase family protein [Xanthomonadales bacterium]|nr:acetoacetate decarboxylase family protein [Xanthomonadales bacterium]